MEWDEKWQWDRVSQLRCSTERHDEIRGTPSRQLQEKATLWVLDEMKIPTLIQVLSGDGFLSYNPFLLVRWDPIAQWIRSQSSSLRMKMMLLDAIDSDFVARLRTDAVAYPTVTKYARRASLVPKKDGSPNKLTIIEPNFVGPAISAALAEHPFSSVRELSRQACLPRSTVHWQLTHSLSVTVRHLRWVSHFFTVEQKQMRVNMSRELLWLLSVPRTR
jgi:hypothetical protein